MLKRYATRLASIAIAILICSRLSADPFVIRVGVMVSADEGLKNTVSSYLLRELRQLPNVVIDDERPMYRIRVIVQPDVLTSGREIGYTMAIAITSPQDLTYLRTVLQALNEGGTPFTDEQWNMVSWNFEWQETFVDLWLRSFGKAGLRENCSELVAKFDSQRLEPRRKDYQKVLELMERRYPKTTPP